MRKLRWLYLLMLMATISVAGSAKTVQSLVVEFPVNGRVTVRTIEAVGKFPRMVFTSEKTGKVLLETAIKDGKDKFLVPEKGVLSPPNLRFRVIRSEGFSSPLIMSVGAYYGGSDNTYCLTVFGEVSGEIKSLSVKPIFANVQGGFYLGYLNDKFGYGLVTWNFVWKDLEAHYDSHRYEAEIYVLENGQFKRTIRRVSRKKYEGNGSASLREIGIKVVDQRKGIPKIKDSLEL